jgi:hypothetical protein
MKRFEQPNDDLDRDAVWALLARNPAARASGRFVDDVMRTVRLAGVPREPWWRRIVSPLGLGGLAAATTAVVLGLLAWWPRPVNSGSVAVCDLSELDPVAEEEMIVAAADHLSSFSDAELVTMLGF